MDLALLLDAIAGPDPLDPLCATEPFQPIAGTLNRSLDRAPRLGVLRGLFWDQADSAARDALNRTIDAWKSHGATVRDVDLPDSFDNVLASHMVIMSVEAAAEHEARFRDRPNDYLPKIRGLVEAGLKTAATTYVHAKQHQRRLSGDFSGCFQNVDVLVTPATRGPAPDPSTTGDPAFNSPWSLVGLPTVSWPTASDELGLPLSVQLIGRAFGEEALFRFAAWCESAASLVPGHFAPLHKDIA
jgi:aspartyl-tRNA(Asn)/glutamyl-tRNA(Gln) amidotransferase subunit A